MSTAENLKITVSDYREMPEGPPYYQLIDGELHMSPSPRSYHQQIIAKLSTQLGSFLEDHAVGVYYPAPIDVFLTDTNVYQPDLLFVSKDRLPMVKKDGVHGAPDLVVEVLSPSTKKFDLGFKKKVYAVAGVVEYWIVDPDACQVKVFHLRASADHPDRTLTGGDTLSSDLLPDLEIDLEKVFADPLSLRES